MSRAVVFDWGGVLMRTVDIRPRMAWERRLDLPPGGLADAVFGSPVWDRAQRGMASLDEVWAEVADRLGVDPDDLPTLRRDFWAGDRLDEELVGLIRELRGAGIRVGLLSNHLPNLRQCLNSLGPLLDAVVISGEEGILKPDPAIYHRALERLGVAPEETVFVDDWKPNVEVARQLGMVSVHFRGIVHLRRVLVEAGLPVRLPDLQPLPGIRAVIFDWGKVLSPLNFLKRSAQWEARLGLPPGTLDQALWGPMWKLLEIGAIPQEAYDAHLMGALGLPDREALEQFYQEYYADDGLHPGVVAAVRNLRGRYRVALLTNAFPGHAESLRRRHGFDPRTEFDVYVNSAEVGMAKPDPAIYQLTLDRLGVRSEEAIFIDDQVRNTDAARMLGIHTIVCADVETALADLAALLGHPV
ncbi:MAG: HAD family phosphatase [Anaerolineae bacterium]|nr:HAD family phosphatase [Anaerolineae bacterium]MDW8069353.1 HAD family phosphatase [Anaerolineae bacterium]